MQPTPLRSALRPGRMPGRRPGSTGRRDVIIGTVLFAVFIAAIVWILQGRLRNPAPQFDAAGCQIGVPAPTALTILMDETDPSSASDRSGMQPQITNSIAALPAGARLTIRALLPEAGPNGVTAVLFDLCKPRNGDDANRWSENATLMKKDFMQRFQRPLQDIQNSIGRGEAQRSSPLIRALSEIAMDPKFRNASRHELLAISDLLEFSNIANMYRPGSYSFADVNKRSYAAVNTLREAFTDTDVHLLQIRNEESRRYHDEAHRAFWKELFRHAGVVDDHYRHDRL